MSNTVPKEVKKQTTLLPTQVTPSQLVTYLSDLTNDLWVRDQPSIMLWGGPGCAKSACSEQLAERRGWGFIDIRLTQVQVIDVMGLPYIDRLACKDGDAQDAVTRFARSVFLPTKEYDRWIMMLDELPSAVPAIQTQAYQLMAEHRIGPHKLPSGVHVIAAGNRMTDRGVVHRMPSPLVNRCVHLEVTADLEDWLTWMYPRNLLPEVAAYLRRNPQRLFEMSAEIDTLPFPTPRSWTYANWTLTNQIRRYGPQDGLRRSRVLLEGLIGPGIATDFLTYLRVFGDLPDVEAIMAGSASPPAPKDPDALFALVSSLVGSTAQAVDLTPFLAYLNKMPRTFAVLALRDSFRQGNVVRDRIATSSAWAQTAETYKDAIFAMASGAPK